MARCARILPLICVAFRFLSSSAPPPQTVLAVPSGSNVSLSCNLSSSEYQTWLRLDSDRILPLFSVRPGKLQGGVIRENHQDNRTLGYKGDLEVGVSLEIRSVTEDDSGVYICSSKNEGKLRFNSAAHLIVMGDSPLPVHAESCWSPGLCLLPAVFSTTLLCITVGFCFCKGHFSSCCCCSKVTKDVPVHYSSLKHLPKPRPFGPADLRLVQDDVVYSSVKRAV